MTVRIGRVLLGLLGVAALSVVAVVWLFWRPLPVELATPAERVPVQVFGLGTVEARILSKVGFEVGATLVELHADHGDRVAEDAVLARLHAAEQDARVGKARAGVLNAEAALEMAQAAVGRAQAVHAQERQVNKRQQALVARQAVSVEAAEEAQMEEDVAAAELAVAISDVQVAQARLEDASAQVELESVLLAHHELRAPYDAVVVARRLDEGQIVSPGQPVLDLQESATPEVRIGVAGDLVQSLAVGDSRSLTVDGRRVAASVRSILPLRDPATRTVDVIFAIDATDVLPGDLARLVLKREIEEPGYWLPTSALAEGGRGLWTAYVAVPAESPSTPGSGATHYLEPRPVEILYETAERVYVRGALADGDLFVTDGLARVVPNQQVRLQRSRQAAAPAVRGS